MITDNQEIYPKPHNDIVVGDEIIFRFESMGYKGHICHNNGILKQLNIRFFSKKKKRFYFFLNRKWLYTMKYQ